jgi:Concanavalin A-like lectin/glucanases superfamily
MDLDNLVPTLNPAALNAAFSLQFVDDSVAKGVPAPDIARALGQQFPGITLDQGAPAIRQLATLTRPPLLRNSGADPVEDAAYQAWLMRLAFPDASPADIGAQVKAGYPSFTLVQVAQVLIHGEPYPVFPGLQPAAMASALVDPRLAGTAPDVAAALHTVYPSLSAVDVGGQLMAPGVFPAITADGMTAALTAAPFAPSDVAAAVAQLFPPAPGGRPLLITFDGTNQVQVPSLGAYNFAPGQDFTVEAWIRAPQQANLHSWDNNIIEKWSDDGNVAGRTGYPFAVRIGNQNGGGAAGRVLAGRYDLSSNPSIQSSGTFLDDRFHHVAYSKQGGQLTLYVDGQVQGTTTDTTSAPTGNDWPLYFGVRGGGMWADNFTGRIMEVRLWNLARSQAQITAAMRRTVDPAEGGLVGYFKLRDGGGTTARDSTAAANNGVITNPQWSSVDSYPLVETTSFPPLGGGGAPFDDTAAALALGKPLTRMRIRSGNIVDSIQAFYGDNAMPAHGGTGGSVTDIVLDPNDPIDSLKGFWGTWFGGTYVQMLVFRTRSGKMIGPFGDMAFITSRNPIYFTFPAGQSLLAFTGTVGTGNNGQSQYLGSFGITTAVFYP